MYHFWEPVIKPLFDILCPREIVEIGADYGNNTRNILEYCRQTDSRVHIVDPVPKFDPEVLKNEFGDIFEFYKSLSLNALPLIHRMDAVLIDGDHNWYTVYHELKLIEKNCRSSETPFPAIIVHDVAWPYARRDLYYQPDNIPEAFRLPYAKKGLRPDTTGMVEKGGLNPHLNNAIYEHNFHSGVLTAIEDFINETNIALTLVTVPGFHGLGIVYTTHHKESCKKLSGFVASLSASDIFDNIITAVEKSRMENLIAYAETRSSLLSLENERRMESEEYEQKIRALEKNIAGKAEQFSAELEERNRKIAGLEEKRQRDREEIAVFSEKYKVLEQKHKALQQMKSKLKSERDQLIVWIKNFRFQFNELMQSRRWRTGHSLISLLTLSKFKKNLTMASDHISRLIHEFERFQFGDDYPLVKQPAVPREREYAVRRYNLTVAVIAWDVGHNPLGRAYLLAEALSRYFHVILLGPSFPRYNHQVWEPLLNSRIEVLPLPGKDFPEFLTVLETVAARIPADVIVSCKARLPSVQLGLMMKAFLNRPLFIDVDDYELSFFKNKAPLTTGEIENNKYKDIYVPFEETWTRFSETLLQYADGLFVSNPALENKFGGMVIPHARDELAFDPSLYDRGSRRYELGIDETDKVVLFLGTPRPHKGVTEVLNAVKACKKPDYKLCVIGTPPDRAYEKQLRKAGGDSLVLVSDQPFARLPENLMIADLVCLIQNEESEISKYQLPAKVVDALAMGIPVLSTRTVPLEPLIQAGAVEPVELNALSGKIDRILSDSEAYRRRQREKRELFLNQYSYQSIGEKMLHEMLHALAHLHRLPGNALDFIKIQENMASEAFSADSRTHDNEGWDVVFFWKQNDTGIYGRRSDMFIKYLSRRSEIKQIAVFDMPISIEALRDKGKNGGIVHDRLIYRQTMLRNLGLYDTEKVSFHTFVYKTGRGDEEKQVWRYPGKNEYMQYIQSRLMERGIRPQQSIFWFYPQNAHITKIVKYFKPKLKVVDLVDDHRTWPDIPEVKRIYITNHYKEVLKMADLALANCQKVQQSFQKYFSDISLIPNGCEMDPPTDFSGNKQLERLKSIKSPRLGYAGNLEQGKIDTDLIRYMAKQRPDWNIILIGSTHANPQIMELDEYANIYFFGVIPYPDVRTWINVFDVAILPHLNSEKTQSMNPLKLYVYCSLGLPVVSTDIDNLDDLRAYVAVAKNHDDFISEVERALGNSQQCMSESLHQCLEQNTWEGRIDKVIHHIKAKMA